MKSIQANGLTLEPQVAAHAEEMFRVLSDPAIYAHENGPPASVEWLRDRYAKLESRASPDGRESWLNWVIRLSSGELIGYVQATVQQGGAAAIAYEMSSAHWGKGLARIAVQAMIDELTQRHGVRSLTAVLKRTNLRSLRLLQRLGFLPVAREAQGDVAVAPDEMLMRRDLKTV